MPSRSPPMTKHCTSISKSPPSISNSTTTSSSSGRTLRKSLSSVSTTPTASSTTTKTPKKSSPVRRNSHGHAMKTPMTSATVKTVSRTPGTMNRNSRVKRSERRSSHSPSSRSIQSTSSRSTLQSSTKLSRNRKSLPAGGIRSSTTSPLPQAHHFSPIRPITPPSLPILIVTRMTDFEPALRTALHQVPNLTISSLPPPSSPSTLTESQRKSLSTARIIFADPDLIQPLLPLAHSVRWVQSLWAGVEPILSAVHLLSIEKAKRAARYAELLAEREAKMAKVREADRILEEANGKVRAMKKRDLTELGNYSKPPPLVKLCLTATCDLLGFGEKLEYQTLKKLLVKENFPRKMGNFDPTTITQKELDRIDRLYLSLPEFTVRHMKNASLVCGVLTNWLLSLRTVCKFCQDVGVQELRKELADLETSEQNDPNDPGDKFGASMRSLATIVSVNGDGEEVVTTTEKTTGEDEFFTLTKIGDCFGTAIAEYCLMQILNFNRHTHEMKEWQNNKMWGGRAHGEVGVFKFPSLKDHTVGIMGGSGNIGLAVGKLLQKVGCTVHGLRNTDPRGTIKEGSGGATEGRPDAVPESSDGDGGEEGSEGADVDSVDELNADPTPLPGEEHVASWYATQSDQLLPFLTSGITVLINCLPATPATSHLLTRDLLHEAYGPESPHPPPLFVNVGRGDVVSSQDLVESLEGGCFVGAALDVVEVEPMEVDDPLWTCRRGGGDSGSGVDKGVGDGGEEEDDGRHAVVVTPHVAATSASVLPEIVDLCRKNLRAFVDGRSLEFVVNVARGY